MPSVLIAPARRADAAELIAANRASRDLHRPWVEPFTDQAGFEAWLERMTEGPCVGLVARSLSTGEMIGVVNLNEIVRGAFQSAYLGYYGMVGQSGQGLMTEAVRLAARHAFDRLGLHRVEANIQPDNLRSIALVRRLGFRLEGFSPRYLRIAGAWRDHQRYALLADDPPPA